MPPAFRKLAWFGAIWAASIGALAMVAGVIRYLLIG